MAVLDKVVQRSHTLQRKMLQSLPNIKKD